jgi:AhpD family alkylhydroperoxidase
MNLKSLKHAVVTAVMMATLTPMVAHAQGGRSPEATATLAEVEKTLGAVPAMVRDMPDENVAPFWEQLKSLQLNPKTALSGKSKELIGLGVAAQIPCRYCIYGHSEFAKLNGASERELREAIATAAIARELSALANGPEAQQLEAPATAELKAAHQELAKAFGGSEPEFAKRYPSVALVSLWKQMKAVTLNGQSALPVKVKALISLAVVTQLPSAGCVKDYTAMARGSGATEQEIQEAVAMAGLTRSASTVLNGAMPDESQWRHDIDSIVRHVSAGPGKKSAAR